MRQRLLLLLAFSPCFGHNDNADGGGKKEAKSIFQRVLSRGRYHGHLLFPRALNTKGEPNLQDTCELPLKVGSCLAYIPSWYHNSTDGICKPFIYGGCGGNENRFETQEECEKFCGVTPECGNGYVQTGEECDDGNTIPNDGCEPVVCKITETCNLLPDPGPCKGYFKMFYHDFSDGSCKEFIYGGCEGNKNRFDTKKECEEKCVDICKLPYDVGDCDGIVPRYYNDASDGVCKLFDYGGCGGNANNFETFQKCQAQCSCDLPPKTGPCEALSEMWYHNAADGTCQTFFYGGCQGNSNQFESQKECEDVCMVL